MRGFISVFTSALLLALAGADTAAREDWPTLPAIALARLDGNGSERLTQFCGRVVVLEFWSLDCAPCARSLATLAALEQQTARDDFAAIAIDVDDDVVAAREFAARHDIGLEMLADPQLRAVDALSIRGVPTALLLDRSGRIRTKLEGFGSGAGQDLEHGVATLLAERGRSTQCLDVGTIRRFL